MAYRRHYGHDTGLARNMLVNLVAALRRRNNGATTLTGTILHIRLVRKRMGTEEGIR